VHKIILEQFFFIYISEPSG